MKDLHEMGLRGELPRYIREFLANRKFRVRVEDAFSDHYDQEEGVPQGPVFTVTLFNIRINHLQALLPSDMHSSLYVDDLQVGCSDPDLEIIRGKLQGCIDKIADWADKNGFSFSMHKTKAVLFTQQPGLHPKPNLNMYSGNIIYENSVKFLGMLFDAKLTWKAHIAEVQGSIGYFEVCRIPRMTG